MNMAPVVDMFAVDASQLLNDVRQLHLAGERFKVEKLVSHLLDLTSRTAT